MLTEISRLSEAVWWVDPYKDLQYHDRNTVTAPFPITDGDGGISCRGLSMSESLEMVTNDVIAWGTIANIESGDSRVIVSRQTATSEWDDEFWQLKIDRVEDDIDRIRQTPVNQRTVKQKTELASLKRALAVYEAKHAAAVANTSGSIETYGRWQYAEYRQDILHQATLNRRARQIMKRYSQPVVRMSATVFDPGYQAGQVVTVSSLSHGIAEDMVIREVTMDFVASKGPVGEEAYAVPRYTLSIGLDPEEPWNIYEYLPLPFPDFDFRAPRFNPPVFRIPDIGGITIGTGDASPILLDSFERVTDSDLGLSTSERTETRPWFSTQSEG
jgi:hypothetical protein